MSAPRADPYSTALCETLCRVTVLGSAGVGKTCIVSQFLYATFPHTYQPTVEEFHRQVYEVGDTSLTLDIVDTSGSDEFPAMRALSIINGDAFVLVYSVDDTDSFENLRHLRDQITELKGGAATPIVVVGNKNDLATECRTVAKETAENIANIEWCHKHVEVSAKDNCNIAQIFKELLSLANIAFSPSMHRDRRMSVPVARSDRRDRALLRKQNSCVIA